MGQEETKRNENTIKERYKTLMLVPKKEGKYKILTISDHPLVSSGVGIQAKYVIEGLLRTDKYQVLSLGAAMKHKDYRPQKMQEWSDDWAILPIDGYGNENMIRDILDAEKPDAIFFVTDPRFYIWLFNMSDEVRDRNIPMLYWHLWDEKFVPRFNKQYYDACDFIGAINKLTYGFLGELEHQDFEYIPHAVDADLFAPMSEEEIKKHKEQALGPNKDKFVYFYNSRNARRKMTSDVVRFFKETLDKVGQDKAFLLMQTNPGDPEGANLLQVCDALGLRPDQIAFSAERISPEQMVVFYNIADTIVCLSSQEGFGLSSLESMMCGTPVISVRTGGLQDQNYIPETGKEFGVSIFPKTQSWTGSQQIPYITDCRCTDEDIRNAYLKMYNMSPADRRSLGLESSEHVRKKFVIKEMVSSWDKALERKIKEFKEHGYRDRIKFGKV